MKRTTVIWSVFLVFLAGALGMWGIASQRRTDTVENPASWSDSDASMPVDSTDPLWGSRYAPVTLVLFSDFQCPFCVRLEDTIDALKKIYGPHKLRIVFKHTPLAHPKARPGHEAAQRVYMLGGSNAYWHFHAKAFQNGKDLSQQNLDAWAKESGVDVAAFNAEDLRARSTTKVGEDIALAKKYGVRGTPTAFVNGVMLKGSQPVDAYRRVIDEQLAQADALAKAGVPKDRIYVELSLKNLPKKEDQAAAAGSASASAEPSAAPEAPKPDRGKVQEDDPTAFRVPLGTSPSKGPGDALVTIVEFGNFQCRFSSQSEETLAEILTRYKDKVRLVWKHRPLPYLRRGTAAAILAEFAYAERGNAGFWDAHQALFARERAAHDEKNRDAFSLDELLAVAKEIGLDPNKIKPALTDENPSTPGFDPPAAAKKYMTNIDADVELSDMLKAEATPHFFINGRRLVGAQGAERFIAVIDEELAKAEALVASGVDKSAVYDKTMETAKVETPEIKLIDPAPSAPWKGKEDAKVEVHIFSDFQCPFCKQVTPTLQLVVETHKDQVKFVWRDRPIDKHELSWPAAQAGREVFAQKGNAGFWAFHDALFELTRTDAFNPEGFEKSAEKAGVDMTAFRAAMDDKRHKKAVEDTAKQADSYGISGTPGFVVTYAKKDDKLEGFFISGAVPTSQFRLAIKSATAKAAQPN